MEYTERVNELHLSVIASDSSVPETSRRAPLTREARRALIAELCAQLSPAERAIARSMERRG